jgi:hypothetical protein
MIVTNTRLTDFSTLDSFIGAKTTAVFITVFKKCSADHNINKLSSGEFKKTAR